MMTAIRDRDAIFARAITIASPKEREAYLTQACGDDGELRRQVEERVAAHFQAAHGATEPAAEAANGAIPSRTAPVPAGATQEPHGAPAPETTSPGKARGTSFSGARGVVLLFLALGAVAIGLAFWAMRARDNARQAMREAEEAREQARKVEEEVQQQRTQAEAARQDLASARDQAVADEKQAKDSVADMKAALAFFQNKVLSAGRPVGWSGGEGKSVTLRQAVDAAEARVATSFEDRPLAEAAVREILGSTYVDLEEPALAVKEYERALSLRDALQGDEHPDTVACRNQLAVVYRLANRPGEAGQLYQPGNPSPTHAAALHIRGVLLLSRGKPAEAGQALRECLAIREKIQPNDWSTFETKSLLGEALLEQKNYADAEPLLRSGYEGLKEHQGKASSHSQVHLTQALTRLVRLYEDWGKEDQAAQWRKQLETARKKLS